MQARLLARLKRWGLYRMERPLFSPFVVRKLPADPAVISSAQAASTAAFLRVPLIVHDYLSLQHVIDSDKRCVGGCGQANFSCLGHLSGSTSRRSTVMSRRNLSQLTTLLSGVENSISSQLTSIHTRTLALHLASSCILSSSQSSGRVMARVSCGLRHHQRWTLSHSMMYCRSSKMFPALEIAMMLAQCPCCQLTKYRYWQRVLSRVSKLSHPQAVPPSRMITPPHIHIPNPMHPLNFTLYRNNRPLPLYRRWRWVNSYRCIRAPHTQVKYDVFV